MKAKLCVILLACITLVPPSQCNGAQPGAQTVQQAVEYVTQGDLSFDQGMYNEALTEYTAAIELDPKCTEAVIFPVFDVSQKVTHDRRRNQVPYILRLHQPLKRHPNNLPLLHYWPAAVTGIYRGVRLYHKM